MDMALHSATRTFLQWTAVSRLRNGYSYIMQYIRLVFGTKSYHDIRFNQYASVNGKHSTVLKE